MNIFEHTSFLLNFTGVQSRNPFIEVRAIPSKVYASDPKAILLVWPWLLLPYDEREQFQQLMEDDVRAFWKSVRGPMRPIPEPVTTPVYETEAPSPLPAAVPSTPAPTVATPSHPINASEEPEDLAAEAMAIADDASRQSPISEDHQRSSETPLSLATTPEQQQMSIDQKDETELPLIDGTEDDGLALWPDSMVGSMPIIFEDADVEAMAIAGEASHQSLISEDHQRSASPLRPATPEQLSPKRAAPLSPAAKDLPMRQVWALRRAPPSSEVWSSIPADSLRSPNKKQPRRRVIRLLRGFCGHCKNIAAAAGGGVATMGVIAGLAACRSL